MYTVSIIFNKTSQTSVFSKKKHKVLEQTSLLHQVIITDNCVCFHGLWTDELYMNNKCAFA